MLNSDSKTIFNKIKIQRSYNGTRFRFLNLLMFMVSFLALTQSILNFLKTLFRFEFSIKIPKNDVKHKNSHGEFSDVKSSNRNPMDDFEIISYCNIFF